MIKRRRKKGIPDQYRQGDVMLERVEALPAGIVMERLKSARTVIQQSVNSPRTHSLTSAKVLIGTLKSGKVRTYIHVEKDDVLEHQEHGHIPIPKGFYAVLKQQQYSLLQNLARPAYD